LGFEGIGVVLKKAQDMKRSRFNEEEVIGILREGEGGSSIKAVYAKHNRKRPVLDFRADFD
jgi:hypothetical protein